VLDNDYCILILGAQFGGVNGKPGSWQRELNFTRREELSLITNANYCENLKIAPPRSTR